MLVLVMWKAVELSTESGRVVDGELMGLCFAGIV